MNITGSFNFLILPAVNFRNLFGDNVNFGSSNLSCTTTTTTLHV